MMKKVFFLIIYIYIKSRYPHRVHCDRVKAGSMNTDCSWDDKSSLELVTSEV